jgi:hypothetical protein
MIRRRFRCLEMRFSCLSDLGPIPTLTHHSLPEFALTEFALRLDGELRRHGLLRQMDC